MIEDSLFERMINQLSSLLEKSNKKKEEALSEGHICALNCVSDSLQQRLEYLKGFANEDNTCKLVECKIEISGIISVLEADVSEASDSSFDKDFKRTLNDVLEELRKIIQEIC